MWHEHDDFFFGNMKMTNNIMGVKEIQLNPTFIHIWPKDLNFR